MADKARKLPVPFLDRLSTKITLTAIVFLFIISAAVAFQVESGFRRNQYGAYSSSQAVLEDQIKNEYLQSTILRARLLELNLQDAGRAAQNAAQFIDGQQPGFEVAALPASHLVEYLDQLQAAPGQYSFLIDPRGEVIAAGTGAESLPEAVEEAHGRAAAGEPAVQVVDLAGKSTFLVSVPLSEPAWRLVMVFPMAAIEQQSRETANQVWASAETTIRSTLVMVFVFFLAGLLGALIALDRLFNNRITQLIEGVQAVAAGSLGATVPDTGQDELGILGRSFNQMVSELGQRTNHLVQSEERYRNLAHSLEERVRESTREIQELYDQAAARSQELEVLYQADEQLYRHLHLDGVLQALADVVADRLQADKTSVLILDEQRQRLVLRAARGFSQASIHRLSEFRLEEGITGQVFQSGEVVAIEDTSTASPLIDPLARAEGICSVLAVPILINNQVIGVFGMNFTRLHRFTPADIRLSQSLAQRAAIAIENARLYERAEQAATLEERQRLSRELHDAITQSLYSLVLLAEAGRRHAAVGNTGQVAHHLARLGETAQQALQEMRLLVYELRPSALAQEGLAGAIRRRLDTVEKRSGVQARLVTEGEMDLPPEVEEQLYRISQEALNNALKHARARSISVFLRRRDRCFEIEIRDDGQGFDPQAASSGGIGLASMRERVDQLGGQIVIESSPGQGTCVRVQVDTAYRSDKHE